MAALKERLSAATFAAWVAPARPIDGAPLPPPDEQRPQGEREQVAPARPVDGESLPPAAPPPAAGPGEAGNPAEGRQQTLAIQLPSAYALERWRRPPIAPALAEAAAALGITVTLQ